MIFDEIWRMQRKSARLLKAYYKKRDQLHREYPQHYGAMLTDEEAEMGNLDTEILIAQSEALKNEAYDLRVPLAPHYDTESWDDFYGPQILTPKAYSDLRSKIRQEKKERRETFTAIIKDIVSPIGALIISILSLLIAYAALHLKH